MGGAGVDVQSGIMTLRCLYVDFVQAIVQYLY